MARGAEINTSLGSVDQIEDRSFARKYKTFGLPINTPLEVIMGYREILTQAKKNNSRRAVMRSLMSNDAIDFTLKHDLPIEAKIPMSLITGIDDGSAIVYIARNNHYSPPQGHQNIQEFISQRGNGRKPIERARKMKESKEFDAVKSLNSDNAKDLYLLWERFGWTMDEIDNFITRIQRGDKNLWFSGMKDNNTGHLVSACNAEAIEFAGIRYIETTEYSTLHDYQGRSLNTTAVSGLVAQVLNDAYYNQTDDLIPVIAAEFNTSSDSASVGASAGFVVADEKGKNLGTLLYNVAVEDEQKPNEVFEENGKKERGISFSMLRNFALGIVSKENIENLYPPEVVQEIISYY